MPAGRPPKPIALRVLQGNPGRRPIPQIQPEPAPAPPDPPAGLPRRVAELWRRYAPILAARGCLTVLDTLKLERALRLVALGDEYLALCEAPPRKGRTRTVHRAWVPAMKLLEKGLSLLGLFGFSPAERVKLHGLSHVDSKTEDPIRAYQRQRPARRPTA